MDRLLEEVEVVEVHGDPTATEVSAIEFDSRRVGAGALFCCVRGEVGDGHDYAAEAVSRGAGALLVERRLGFDVPQVVVAPGQVRPAMAAMACAFFDYPARSLITVGVTGTNGKTTVTHLLASIFDAHDWPTAVIGTLDGARTTPEAPRLQALLAEARDASRRAVAMEVSSHALAQRRVDGIRYDAAVFTNLSHDHLDYHGTMEAYFEAKAALFTNDRAALAVVNEDDSWGRRLLALTDVPSVGFSMREVHAVTSSATGTSFTWRGRAVRLALSGAFHVANALAAASTALALGVPEDDVVAGLERAAVVPGRFEVVPTAAPFTVVVDYAHTPDGLAVALDSAHQVAGSHRVLCVFGCGGDRDRDKRPAMGAVAAAGADVAVLTSDNPRTEDPDAIIAAVLAGVGTPSAVIVRRDRADAIAVAVDMAAPGDVVVVAGKGHETEINVAGTRLAFDDRVVAADAVRRRLSGAGEGRVISLMASGGIALWAAAAATPFLIRWLGIRRIGQQIREDGPYMHLAKAGTPTMGGVALVIAGVVGYLISHAGTHVAFSRAGILVMGVMVCAGGIGFIDDFIKVRHRRSLGLNKRAKLGAQIVMAVAFALLAEHWAGANTHLSFTRWNSLGINLGQTWWVVWAVIIVVGTANAVNLTDGLDGLASGSATFCFACLAVVGYWQFRHLPLYHVGAALDLALAAVSLAGACLGFLWWNAAPARIFMGDTGSLAIGSGLAALCLQMNLQLLLPVIGGLFVIETLSVVLQVVSFRVFGRRVFRMAPLHHHFELLGWPETTVIVRFWILGGLFAALGLGVFYADFLSATGLR